MTISRTSTFLGVALLGATAALPAECPEKVIEWVKEPGRTTKSITLDGRLVYRNVWVQVGSGKPREMGPGWLDPRAPSRTPARPPATRPATRPTPRPAPPPTRPAATAPGRSVSVTETRARQVALSLENVPYAKGGVEPSRGLSAPGVVTAFFTQLGIQASPEILAQYRAGDFVLKTQIRPGDLVFHSSRGKAAEVPDMVGVALGSGEMVYMSGSKQRVVRADYESSWWEERYKGARRVLGTRYAVPVGSSPWVEPSQRTFEGIASYYGCGDGFDHSGTASGEVFDANKLTAAHKTLPLGTLLDVTHLGNGRRVRVRVNDRGPYVAGRVLDLSCRAARDLQMTGAGIARIRAEVVY